MNKVFLIGRLSKEPDLRYTSNGTAVCQITVAVNRPATKENKNEADFINVVIWNKQAENVAKYMQKGRQIAIEGRIQNRSYDNSNGKKTYVTEVIASSVEFIGSGNKNENVKSDGDVLNKPSYKAEEIDDIPMPNDPFQEQMTIEENELPW